LLVLPRDCSDQFAFPVSAIGSLFPLHSPAERTSAGSAPNAKQFCEIEVGAFFNSHRNFSTVIHWQKKTAHRPIFLGTTKVPENSTGPGASSCGEFAANIEPRLFHDDSGRVVPNRRISTVFDKACSASDPCPIDPTRQCNPDHKLVCQMRHTAARTSARVITFRVEKEVKSAKDKNYESGGR
jgi:hypothetical protein